MTNDSCTTADVQFKDGCRENLNEFISWNASLITKLVLGMALLQVSMRNATSI